MEGQQNMKLKHIGQSLVIILSVTMMTIQNITKLAPDALVLKDPETKEPIFRLSAGSEASLNKNGAKVNDEDTDGFARMTIMLPVGATEDYIKENYGFALEKLDRLSKQVLEAEAGVNKTMATVFKDMEVG